MKRHTGRCFSISWEYGAAPHLLIIVPKRYVANAVERNKIKRWARELFRSTGFTDRGIQMKARLSIAYKDCTYHAAKNDFKEAFALLEDSTTMR